MSNFGSARFVLVSAPSVGSAESSVCRELLLGDASTPKRVLHVDFIKSPADRVSAWEQHGESAVAELGIVNVEAQTRSAATDSAATQGQGLPVTVESVSGPGNLTQIGMAITKILTDWEGADSEIRVCFHSVSALLHYTDVSSVFQFLNALRSQLRAHGAVGHVHIDPDAQDEQVINQLKPLFDAVVEVDLDGSTTVTNG